MTSIDTRIKFNSMLTSMRTAHWETTMTPGNEKQGMFNLNAGPVCVRARTGLQAARSGGMPRRREKRLQNPPDGRRPEVSVRSLTCVEGAYARMKMMR